jgi:hypothetical protein
MVKKRKKKDNSIKVGLRKDANFVILFLFGKNLFCTKWRLTENDFKGFDLLKGSDSLIGRY